MNVVGTAADGLPNSHPQWRQDALQQNGERTTVPVARGAAKARATSEQTERAVHAHEAANPRAITAFDDRRISGLDEQRKSHGKEASQAPAIARTPDDHLASATFGHGQDLPATHQRSSNAHWPVDGAVPSIPPGMMRSAWDHRQYGETVQHQSQSTSPERYHEVTPAGHVLLQPQTYPQQMAPHGYNMSNHAAHRQGHGGTSLHAPYSTQPQGLWVPPLNAAASMNTGSIHDERHWATRFAAPGSSDAHAPEPTPRASVAAHAALRAPSAPIPGHQAQPQRPLGLPPDPPVARGVHGAAQGHMPHHPAYAGGPQDLALLRPPGMGGPALFMTRPPRPSPACPAPHDAFGPAGVQGPPGFHGAKEGPLLWPGHGPRAPAPRDLAVPPQHLAVVGQQDDVAAHMADLHLSGQAASSAVPGAPTLQPPFMPADQRQGSREAVDALFRCAGSGAPAAAQAASHLSSALEPNGATVAPQSSAPQLAPVTGESNASQAGGSASSQEPEGAPRSVEYAAHSAEMAEPTMDIPPCPDHLLPDRTFGARHLIAEDGTLRLQLPGKRTNAAAAPPIGAPMRACPTDLETHCAHLLRRLQPDRAEAARLHSVFEGVKRELVALLPDATVHLFGSVANGLFVRDNNDLDVTVHVPPMGMTREAKTELLKDIEAHLVSVDMQDVLCLTKARIPLIKFKVPPSDTAVDVTINNELPLHNTDLIKTYVAIDERVRQLVFVVKHWAKARNVNDTYRGTLSSYAWVMLCIFIAQQAGLVPVLTDRASRRGHAFEIDTFVKVDDDTWTVQYHADPGVFRERAAANPVTLGQLLAMFFDYFAYRFDFYTEVVCPARGYAIPKASLGWTRKLGTERHVCCIQDPFLLSHDLGRTVDPNTVKLLQSEFRRAARLMYEDAKPLRALVEPYRPDARARKGHGGRSAAGRAPSRAVRRLEASSMGTEAGRARQSGRQGRDAARSGERSRPNPSDGRAARLQHF